MARSLQAVLHDRGNDLHLQPACELGLFPLREREHVAIVLPPMTSRRVAALLILNEKMCISFTPPEKLCMRP
jgi:hypothetical protein